MANSENIIKKANDKKFIKEASDRELQEAVWIELRKQSTTLSQIDNSNKIIRNLIQIIDWITILSL